MKHRIKSTKAGQAYVSMRGWHKASPPRDGRDSQVGLGDTPDEDMQELQRENSDEYDADHETLSDVLEYPEQLAKTADAATSWLSDVDPTEYDANFRRQFQRDHLRDLVDNFNEVSNAIASTDWEISSRKSGKRKTTKAAYRANTLAEKAMRFAEDCLSEIENLNDEISSLGLLDEAPPNLDLSDLRDRLTECLETLDVIEGDLADYLDQANGTSNKSRRRRTLKAGGKIPRVDGALRSMTVAVDNVESYVQAMTSWIDGADGEDMNNVGVMDTFIDDVKELDDKAEQLNTLLSDAKSRLP